MAALYEISFEIETIMRRVIDNGGAITEADEAELAALDIARADKLKAYALVAANAEAEAEGMIAQAKAYSAPLLKKAQAQENLVARLKQMVMDDLVAHNEKTAGDKKHGWRIQNGPPKVDITNDAAIPPHFWHQPSPELCKSEISDMLKSGGEVPGARLIQTEHIRLT